jgi:predicted CXXCH cytochrome family protein
MLNKKLVLGGLVAGSFLLPLVADAGVVTGPCVNCHTMHAMQNGVSLGGPNAQLLLGTGCTTCHAHAGVNGAATGIASTGIPAPQVDNELVNYNAAGSFSTAANSDALQHNLAVVSAAIPDGDLANTPPGGVAAAQIICQSCHGGNGGHHGTLSKTAARTGASSTNTYRQLYNGATGVAVISGDANYNVGDTGTLVYNTAGADTTTINGLCATCHTNFHTLANQQVLGAWVRHPTDVTLTSAGAAYTAAYAASVNTPAELVQIPLGNDAVNNDEVMCVSCHRAHGSAQPDLLRFVYSDSQAGDTTADFGCESCHGAK